MQFLDLSLVCTIVTTVLPCKYICKPFDSLLLPLANLIGVNIVPGCDLYNRRSLSHCFTRYLCFELPRISVPLCFAHLGATSCQSYILHLIRLSDFRGPPLLPLLPSCISHLQSYILPNLSVCPLNWGKFTVLTNCWSFPF